MVEALERLVEALRRVEPALLSGADCATAADCLAVATGASLGDAKAALETAAALPAIPEVRDGLAAGMLSVAQAGEVTRTEIEHPGSAAALVGVARNGSLQGLREAARRIRLNTA